MDTYNRYDYEYTNMSDLVGKTFVRVVREDDAIKFDAGDGSFYVLEHRQDCCEHVYIESVVGDIEEMSGQEILVAEESTGGGPPLSGSDESYTWTFFKLATIKGYVDIRFYGSSNGYYGESASLYFYPAPKVDTDDEDDVDYTPYS